MKRGQLLSFDAILAIVLIVFMLGAVSATSENLKAGVSEVLSWYDRTTVPETMLDVLLQSSGTPPNWDENVTALVVPGLRKPGESYVDYNRALLLFELLDRNETRLQSALTNLSLGHCFMLDMYLGVWSFRANFSWNPGAGLPTGFNVYNGSCWLSGNTYLYFDEPTLIPCEPLDVRGQAHIISDSPLCIAGDVGIDYRGSADIAVGDYPPTTDYPYLAIGGDWVVRGGTTTYVGGSVYVWGGLIGRGLGSWRWTISIAKDLVIYGNTNNTYVIDISGASLTINVGIAGYTPGNVYLQVDGTWYASNQTDVWYRLTPDGWERVSLPPRVVVPQGVIRVNGYPLSRDWVPPEPPECIAPGGGSLGLSLLEGNYTYPQQLNSSQVWNRIVYEGNFTRNPVEINASWVAFAQRNAVVSLLIYNRTMVVENSTTLLAGVLRYAVPNYALLRVEVPEEEGYLLVVVLDGSRLKALGVWRTSTVKAAVWEARGGGVVLTDYFRGTENYVEIPWSALFSESTGVGHPVMLYSYANTFSEARLVDLGDIGVLLEPMYQPLLVKLWVWDS